MDCIYLPGSGYRLSLLLRPLGFKAHRKARQNHPIALFDNLPKMHSAFLNHMDSTKRNAAAQTGNKTIMQPGRGRGPMFFSPTTRPPCKTGGRCLGDLPPPLWRETLQRRQSESHTNGTAGTCRREILLPACSLRRRCGCDPGRHRTAPSRSVVAFPLQDRHQR
ncbi:unnamed protein product [Ectocarpus sp. 12 AP-2014]